MEFDKNLLKLNGCLMSLGSRGLLNTLDPNVVQILQEALTESTEEDKKKATFFLILNTELSVSEDLKNDENIGLLVNLTTPIDKNYLIFYIYELNLQSYLNHIIENCPSALTLEILNAVIEQLKNPAFHKPKLGFEHLYKLWQSVFCRIIKIQRKGNDDGSDKLLLYFEDIFCLIKKVIMTSLKLVGDEILKFVGAHLYYFFQSVLYFKNFMTNNELNYLEDDDLFQLSINLKNNLIPEIKNPGEKCMEIIFENLRDMLEPLTVDLWIDLSETHIDESELSMQELIGNCIYEICENPDEIMQRYLKNFEMLSILKLKPKSEKDKMKEAEIHEIIKNIENGDKKWLKGLLNHSDFLMKKSLDCLVKNLEFIDPDDAELILEKCYTYLKQECSDESSDFIKTLFLQVFNKSNETSKWLKHIFLNEKNLLLTKNFKTELVETFNKISNQGHVEVESLVCLCLQNKSETLEETSKIGIMYPEQMNFSLEVLRTVREACTVGKTLQLVVVDVFENHIKAKQIQNFCKLIQKLLEEKLLDRNFPEVLLQKLVNDQPAQTSKITLVLEFFKSMCEAKLVEPNYELLDLMSGALTCVSWVPTMFSLSKIDIRDLVDEIVVWTVRSLKEQNQSPPDSCFQSILKLPEMDQAIFCDLWLISGKVWTGESEFHSGVLALAYTQFAVDFVLEALTRNKKSSLLRTSFVTSFFLVLPFLTYRKWETIFRRLVGLYSVYEVLEIVTSSLRFAFSAYPPCHEFCLRNFARLLKAFSPNATPKEAGQLVLRALSLLYEIRGEERRENLVLILSSVLLELVDRSLGGNEPRWSDYVVNAFKLVNVEEVENAVRKKLTHAEEN